MELPLRGKCLPRLKSTICEFMKITNYNIILHIGIMKTIILKNYINKPFSRLNINYVLQQLTPKYTKYLRTLAFVNIMATFRSGKLWRRLTFTDKMWTNRWTKSSYRFQEAVAMLSARAGSRRITRLVTWSLRIQCENDRCIYHAYKIRVNKCFSHQQRFYGTSFVVTVICL